MCYDITLLLEGFAHMLSCIIPRKICSTFTKIRLPYGNESHKCLTWFSPNEMKIPAYRTSCKFKVLQGFWKCPLLEMVVKWGMRCCPLFIIDVEWWIRSILMRQYLNSAIRLVFFIKLLKVFLNYVLVQQAQWLHQYEWLKSDNGFAWIAAQPLMEPLLNMHMELPYTKDQKYFPIFHWTQCYNKTKVTQRFALIPDQIKVEIGSTLWVLHYKFFWFQLVPY